MPYIRQDKRPELFALATQLGQKVKFEGEVNYAVTTILKEWMARNGGVRYANINAVVGILECVKQEFYRRIAAPYEDCKCAENGDVFGGLVVE